MNRHHYKLVASHSFQFNMDAAHDLTLMPALRKAFDELIYQSHTWQKEDSTDLTYPLTRDVHVPTGGQIFIVFSQFKSKDLAAIFLDTYLQNLHIKSELNDRDLTAFIILPTLVMLFEKIKAQLPMEYQKKIQSCLEGFTCLQTGKHWTFDSIKILLESILPEKIKKELLIRFILEHLPNQKSTDMIEQILQQNTWLAAVSDNRFRNDLNHLRQLGVRLRTIKSGCWAKLFLAEKYFDKISTDFQQIKNPQIQFLIVERLLDLSISDIESLTDSPQASLGKARPAVLHKLSSLFIELVKDPRIKAQLLAHLIIDPSIYRRDRLRGRQSTDNLSELYDTDAMHALLASCPEPEATFFHDFVDEHTLMNRSAMGQTGYYREVCTLQRRTNLPLIDILETIDSLHKRIGNNQPGESSFHLIFILNSYLISKGLASETLAQKSQALFRLVRTLKESELIALLRAFDSLTIPNEQITDKLTQFIHVVGADKPHLGERLLLSQRLVEEGHSLEDLAGTVAWEHFPFQEGRILTLEILKRTLKTSLRSAMEIMTELNQDATIRGWDKNFVYSELPLYLLASAREHGEALPKSTKRFTEWIGSNPDQNLLKFIRTMAVYGFSLNRLIAFHERVNKRIVNQIGHNPKEYSKEFVLLLEEWFSSHMLRHTQYANIVLERFTDNLSRGCKNPIVGALRTLTKQYKNERPKELLKLVAAANTFHEMAGRWPKIDAAIPLNKMVTEIQDQCTKHFIKKFEIPKAALEKSPLTDEQKSEAILNFSFLGGNHNIGSRDRDTFRLLVIADLLNVTAEVKQGQIPPLLLDIAGPAGRRILSELDLSRFPGIDTDSFITDWTRETEQTVHMNAGTVTPQEEINQINHHIQDCVDHLSTSFKETWESLKPAIDTESKRKAFQKLLAVSAHSILLKSPQEKSQLVNIAFPDLKTENPLLWEELHALTLNEALPVITNLQRNLSLYKQLADLQQVQKEFFDRLGTFEECLGRIEEKGELLEKIGYRTPESPGIFLWTSEIKFMRNKMRRFTKEQPDEAGRFKDDLSSLGELVDQFEKLTHALHDRINVLYADVKKVSKNLAKAGESEGARQLLNVNHFVDQEKEARSEILTIQDLTRVYAILAALKEDNHCLSPTSEVNGDTGLSLLDPNRRLLVIRNEEGRLKANMLLTLGHYQERPCLILDNIYSLGEARHFFQPILNFLIQRFANQPLFLFVPVGMMGYRGKDMTPITKTKPSNPKIILPKPEFGDGYIESGDNPCRYSQENIYQSQGHLICLSGERIPQRLKPGEIPDFQEMGQSLATTLRDLASPKFHVGTSSPGHGATNLHIQMSDPIQGQFPTEKIIHKIELNLTTLQRQDQSWALDIQIQATSNRQGQLFPGQDQPGTSPRLLRLILKQIKEVAKDYGYQHLMADPEFYHMYFILQRAGFHMDTSYELTPYYREVILRIEKGLKEAGINSLRKRSQMVHSGAVTTGRGTFQWPTGNDKIYMLYDLTKKEK